MVSRAFSVEDGNLATKALVTTRNKIYKDIDLTFANRPSGDVYKKTSFILNTLEKQIKIK